MISHHSYPQGKGYLYRPIIGNKKHSPHCAGKSLGFSFQGGHHTVNQEIRSITVEGQPPQRERERRVAAATRRYLGGKPERREYLRTVKLNIKTCTYAIVTHRYCMYSYAIVNT